MRWSLPRPGVYKINCDATIDGARRKVGFGIVIRDLAGCVMACSSQVLIASFSTQTAETMAIGKAILFSWDCGLFPCVLEYDAAMVVKWIVDGSHLDSAYGAILADIAGLRKDCGDLSVDFTPRKANQVAHVLAKHALKNFDDFFLVGRVSSLHCS